MVDGSMILTRTQGWKEVKIGRVCEGNSVCNLHTSRNFIKDSEYRAHLGSHSEFEEKMGGKNAELLKKQGVETLI